MDVLTIRSCTALEKRYVCSGTIFPNFIHPIFSDQSRAPRYTSH